MTRPPVERLRRLVLVALVVVAMVLAGSYGLRRWRAYQARRDLPAEIAGDIQQQAEEFRFSRSEEGRTLFTVQASRTIERTGDTTILEDVVAVIHGHRGERADEIRTGRCEYDVDGTGEIYCPGEVTVKLGGANPSGAADSAARSIRLTTTGVRFDTAEGVAWTDQPVRFVFPEGSGEAVGLRYQAQEPAARLESQVSIQLDRETGAPIRVQGSQLHYYARTQALELLPPLSVQMEDRGLVADRMRMEMDKDFRTRRIQATGNVRAQGHQDGRDLTLRARRAVAVYAPDGRLERLRTIDSVEFTGQSRESEETLTSREAVFHFNAVHRRLERVIARGGAELVVRTAEETRELRGPVLELILGTPAGNQQLLTASQRGTLVLKRPGGEQQTLMADHIQLEFQAKQRLRSLTASGQVETQANRPDGTAQTTHSDEFRARFDDEGKVAEAEQWGHFRYEGGRWQAEAGRAQYRMASESFLLQEQPALWDATTRTTARILEVAEKTGALRAEGDVRTTQRPATDEGTGFGTGAPVHLAAERMRAERERGWARYEGQARMWEGENRLAASAIELFQEPGKLVAEGNVTGLFLERVAAVENPDEEPEQPQETRRARAQRRAVTVTSERFTYLERERRGVFEENVRARNDFGTLTAPRLEVFLAAESDRGSQSLERAHADGGVRIEQEDAQASSEQADYAAEAQTIVLSGGTPKIVDAQRGTVTGAKLTLFLADGRILVNSGEGTRTVTRRPWTR